MSSTYTGAAGNVSLGAAAAITIPSSGDARTAASTNTPLDKLADYAEAFRQMLAGSGLPITEGFESTSFPPASPLNAWATPSKNFGTDLSYVRDTSTPIVGTASANRPAGQTASTNSSLGFSLYLTSPSRIAFAYNVLCNPGTDSLQFFIDGVQFAKLTTNSTTVAVSGRSVSDLLREGYHTFDWRFVRGASASVASEAAKVDTVEVIPESAWQYDLTRVIWHDEGFVQYYGQALTISPAANSTLNVGPWILTTGANIGDFITQELLAPGGTIFGIARQPFIETRLELGTLTNIIVEFGLADGSAGPTNGVLWVYDSSASANWKLRVVSAGTTVDVDTGVAAVAAAWHRLGLSWATVGALSGVLFTYDGKAIGAGSGNVCQSAGAPTGFSLQPHFKVKSVTGAGVVFFSWDWFRVLMLR